MMFPLPVDRRGDCIVQQTIWPFVVRAEPYHYSVPMVPWRVDFWRVSWMLGRRRVLAYWRPTSNWGRQRCVVGGVNAEAWTGRRVPPSFPRFVDSGNAARLRKDAFSFGSVLKVFGAISVGFVALSLLFLAVV